MKKKRIKKPYLYVEGKIGNYINFVHYHSPLPILFKIYFILHKSQACWKEIKVFIENVYVIQGLIIMKKKNKERVAH